MTAMLPYNLPGFTQPSGRGSASSPHLRAGMESGRKYNPNTSRKSVRIKGAIVRLFACSLMILCIASASGDQGDVLEGAGASPGGTAVRVALGLGQSAAALTVRQGSYTLSDPGLGADAGRISAGQKIHITPTGGMLNIAVDGVAASFRGNRALLAPEGGDVDILMYEARTYRGGFLIENTEGALNVINILDVDLYLLGVLPMEMGLPSAPAEALKAQAVVSRTYALKKRSAARSYDLVSGSSDQLYGGYGNEKSYTTAAVEATGGQAIFYDGQLIEAFFSSNGGGFTEDAENVWNESLPYAKAVASPYDASALDAPQDSGGYPGITYHWQVRYTLEELQSRITQWNKDYPDRKINIGALRSINAYALAYDPAGATITGQPNASGRVTKLDLLGADGLHSLYRENVRWFLGLRSALFTLTPEGGIAVRNGAGAAVMLGESIEGAKGLAANGQPSAINPGSGSFFVLTANGIEEIKKENGGAAAAYLIDGKGYGHGVGLSQWGAIGMAQAGKTYRQIIEHYYNQGKNDGRLALRNMAEND